MALARRIAFGLLLVGCAGAALADRALAQTTLAGQSPDTSSFRAKWQRQVLEDATMLPSAPDRGQAVQSCGFNQQAARTKARQPVSQANYNRMVFDEDVSMLGGASMSVQPEEIPPGAIVEGPSMEHAITGSGGHRIIGPTGPGGCSSCGDGIACGDCGGCGDCGACCDDWYGCAPACGPGCGPCGPWQGYYQPGWWRRNLSLSIGVHGFKGPFDQGRNGNFGIHEGVNFGTSLLGIDRIGFQVGFQAVHSNFSGDRANGFREADRNQMFLTTGIFHRKPCGGLQWGVVFDFLRDSYYSRADISQMRAELSLVRPGCSDFGFWGAFGTGRDRVVDGELEPTDLFAFFYRRQLRGGGEGRFWAGFTGAGDGLLGGDLRLPISRGLAIENRVGYLVPRQSSSEGGQTEEAWSLNIQLVWYLGTPAPCIGRNQFRPLFGVADNSRFLADMRD